MKIYFAAAVIIALLCWSNANAAEIKGTVRSVTADVATITIEGESAPNVGDAVEIYFKLPGADAEISVANGHVYEITGPNIMVEIEKTTGAVAKDQLARITSAKPKQKATRGTPAAGSDPATAKAMESFAAKVMPPNAASTPATSAISSPTVKFTGELESNAEGERPGELPPGAVVTRGSPLSSGNSTAARRTPPEPRTPPAASNPTNRFAGKWNAVDKNASYSLTLNEDGNRVTGTYDLQGGSLTGVVEGDVLVATWRQPGNRRGGSTRLKLSADGQTLSGRWEYDPSTFNSGLNGSDTWTFKRATTSP